MTAPNKCRVRWTNANGTHWHSCILAGDHGGRHENINGLKPASVDLLHTFNAWGQMTGSLTEDNRTGGRER